MSFRVFVFVLSLMPLVQLAHAEEIDEPGLCQIAPIGDEVHAVVLDINQGSRLTNIRLGEARDSAPIVSVDVRKQDKPVQLFLNSRGVNIWEISAEVGSVDKIYIFTQFISRPVMAPLTAIRTNIDIPILYVDTRKCLEKGRNRVDSNRRFNNIAQFLDLELGKAIRIKESVPRAEKVVIHDGYVRFTEEDVSFDARPGIESLLQSFPGGYVELDPSSVRSSVRISALNVPPETMGVLQYLESGVFRVPTDEDLDAFLAAFGSAVRPKDLAELGTTIDLVVTRSVELPSRLFGAKSINLLALPGVELTGETGGCIQYIEGPRFDRGCGAIQNAFQQFKEMLDVQIAEICSIVETSEQTKLFVARYDPKNFWKRRISILPSTEAVLVVDSPVSVRWTLDVPSSSRLTHVIFLGNADQEIEGIPEESTVVDYVVNNVRPLMPRECYRMPASSSERAFGVFADSVLSMIGRQLSGIDPAISIVPQAGR